MLFQDLAILKMYTESHEEGVSSHAQIILLISMIMIIITVIIII